MASKEENAGIDLAHRVRTELDLSDLPIRDLIEIVASYGLDVIVMDVDNASSEEGLVMVDPDLDIHAIAVRTSPNSSRQRFTLAHELGHVLSGDHSTVDDYHRPSTPSERRANYFARHFLFPIEAAKRLYKANDHDVETTLNAAIRQYHVSPDVARFQLEKIGVPVQHLEEFKDKKASDFASKFGWTDQFALRSELSLKPQSPRILTALLARAYQDGFVTHNEVTSWNATSPETWEAIEKAVQD